MSICAIIPIASLVAANNSLAGSGFGPRNFSVPAFGATGPTHAALHASGDAALAAAVKAIPGVVWEESAGDPVVRTRALITAQGSRWGAQAPDLPASGPVSAGELYRYNDLLWSVLQAFDRTTFGLPPSNYPALIRNLKEPGKALPWVQPVDQFDAYKLANPFTGLPDRCTHLGNTWAVSQADGGGNNVFEPGAFGWVVV